MDKPVECIHMKENVVYQAKQQVLKKCGAV